MRLDLSELAGIPGKHVSADIDEPCPGDAGFTCIVPVKGRLSFDNTGTLLLMEGDLYTVVKLECGRCLAEFTLPADSAVEEEFKIEKVGDSMQILPLDEEEVETDLVQNNLLDVDELIRQSMLVVLPIQPLCGPDCKGLCPTCGENLNVRQCHCLPAETESPFKALADLFEQDTE